MSDGAMTGRPTPTPTLLLLDLVDLYAEGEPSRGPGAILGVQARTGLREEVVLDYLDLLVEGTELPPIGVLHSPATGELIVWDGYHRLEAHRRAGRLQIAAHVEEGDSRAALLRAAGANAGHGLRRSHADTRRAVLLLLEDGEYSRWSDRAIAERARVHHSYVGRLRRELAGASGADASAPRIGRDGREIRTEAIATANRARSVADEVEAGGAAREADEGEDRDEDLDGGSSPPAEVVTGHGVETARPPSSDREYVIDEHDPMDLVRHPKVAAHRFGGGEPVVMLAADEVVEWRDRTWVALGGEYAGPYDAVYLVRLRSPSGPLPELRSCDRFRQDHGRSVGRGARRWVLDCTEVARGVRRPEHATDLDHRRGVPVFTKAQIREWDGADQARRHELEREAPYAADAVVGPRPPQDEDPVAVERDAFAIGPIGPNGIELLASSQTEPTRDPLDRYYTPERTALAVLHWLLGWLRDHLGIDPDRDLRCGIEPHVGAGAWVQALRILLPDAIVDRCDLDPDARGLDDPPRRPETTPTAGEFAVVCDWRWWPEGGLRRPRGNGAGHGPASPRKRWDFAMGNPPYSAAEIVEHLDACLERCGIVALLLRETITGSARRLPWWRDHRPVLVAKVLPRPSWEGPVQHETGDMVDTVLVVWAAARLPCSGRAIPSIGTRFDWVDVPRILASHELAEVVGVLDEEE